MNTSEPRFLLFASLRQRFRPEDVAESILALLGERLENAERRQIEKAARGSLLRNLWGRSSMPSSFRPVIGFDRQLGKARELFPVTAPAMEGDAAAQLARLPVFMPELARTIGAESPRFDFRVDRLNREAREQRGFDLSRRRYNKLFRFLGRLEAKAGRVRRELNLRELTMIGKSRLASRLVWEDFGTDDASLAFVAYLTARANLRSEFTIDGQQPAFDEIAAMLLERCFASPDTRWWAIAHVHCTPRVITMLTDEEKGRLLASWFAVLDRVAVLLRETWQCNDFKRATMIVARGNDSSTWNQLAGAWNRAREDWFRLLEAMGCEDGLEQFCPGKIMRLMAADVAAWHRSAGGKLDPQTAVWNDLPPPWEVLIGTAECPRSLVEETCSRHGVDAVKSGWTHARGDVAPVAFRPTPELVHGVTIGHPDLALLLRRWRVFSGKSS